MESSPEAKVKLTFELREAVGFDFEQKEPNFKFIKRDKLLRIFQRLSISLPQLQDCKTELVLVKVCTEDRLDLLKIFLTEDVIEQELGSAERIRAENLNSEPVDATEEKTKGWSCLGSAEEIVLSHAPKNRPLQIIEAQVQKRSCNRRAALAESEISKSSASFAQSKEEIKLVERRCMDVCIQVRDSKDVEAQTVINFPKNVWVQWSPQTRDFDSEHSAEQKTFLEQWLRTKSLDLLDFAHHNSILENHTDDFQSLTISDKLESAKACFSKPDYLLTKIISSFSECQGVAVAHSWHPSNKSIVAVSYGDFHKNAAAEDPGVCDELSDLQEKCSTLFAEKIIIWNCAEAKALVELSSSFQVSCISFCPADENFLLGGCSNGDIKLWKVKLVKGGEAAGHDTLDPEVTQGCKKPIVGLHLLKCPAEKFQEFLSVSSDGLILVWTTDFTEIKETGVQFSVTSKDLFCATASALQKNVSNPLRILVGSHDGAVSIFEIDPELKLGDEDCPTEPVQHSQLDASSAPKMHDGPVSNIKQCPLDPDLFISVGGCTFAVFSAAANLANPTVLKKGNKILSSGCWSLYCKNIFYICTNAGKLQVWNLANCKSSLEAQFSLSPSYIKDLAFPDCSFQTGLLPLTDNRGSLILCKIPPQHQRKQNSTNGVFKGSVPLQILRPSSKLRAEGKRRQREKGREEEVVRGRMEGLVQPPRGEVALLREALGHRDRATRLEAGRRLALLELLPGQLLTLKRVDAQRLLQIQLPMLDLQRRHLRKSVLREARVEENADFLK